jgi:hypothetical protein
MNCLATSYTPALTVSPPLSLLLSVLRLVVVLPVAHCVLAPPLPSQSLLFDVELLELSPAGAARRGPGRVVAGVGTAQRPNGLYDK